MNRARLERRLSDLVRALDPHAPPPAGARRTAAGLALARRLADEEAAAERIARERPEFLRLARRIHRLPLGHPDRDAALSHVLAILAGDTDPDA